MAQITDYFVSTQQGLALSLICFNDAIIFDIICSFLAKIHIIF